MDILNCLVALGGDKGNTVAKSGITAAEAAVLRAIHGDDGLLDVEVVGQAKIDPRDEKQRLVEKYHRARNDDNILIVEAVFPGTAPLIETVEQLGLHDSMFKVERKMPPKPKKELAADDLFA